MGHAVALIREKREARKELHVKASALLPKPGEVMSEADSATFDAIMKDMDTLKAEIDRYERFNDQEADLNTRIEIRAGREDITKGEAEGQVFEESKVFGAFMRLGFAGLNLKAQQVMGKYKTDETEKLLKQSGLGIYAAQSVGTGSAGGFTVPQDSRFMSIVESALKAFGGMRVVATILPTSTGADLPMPTENNTAQEGEQVDENAAVAAELDLVFGQLVLKSFKYSTKPIIASLEFLQDSAIDVENFIGMKAGERVARILNKKFTTGAGTTEPKGIVTASVAGKVGAAGQTLTVIYDDLVDLIHSVDEGYRRNGARWMMNDASLKVIRKLKDTQNRPLWQPDIRVGEPDQILGYGYVINNDVAVMAANAKSILFGQFGKYLIRDVMGLTMLRLVELYALKGQVGFLGFSRHDGNLLDAGTNPVKHYANSAT